MSKTTKAVSSKYIDALRRDYSLYVMQQRAVISEADGLKSSGRRLLWVARDGQKTKVNTLAGAVAPLHPHDAPEGAVNTLAGFYTNNIPLLQGFGAFGTFLEPKAYGAGRYTSVKLSQFAKDVLMADIDIVPMVPNYDQTEMEPKHFLPLVPISLLNPSEGIAIGFSCNVAPRALGDIISSQIAYLRGKRFKEPLPCLETINSRATSRDAAGRWVFEGAIERTSHNVVTITALPYGITHAQLEAKLNKLLASETVVDVRDNSSKSIDVQVVFKRGELKNLTDEDLLKMFGLVSRVSESMIMVAFSGDHIVEHTYETAIKSFTDWRLGWYTERYKHQLKGLSSDLEYVQDLIIAIRSGVMDRVTKTTSKTALEAALTRVGVKNPSRISARPAYGFTKEELAKALEREKELVDAIAECEELISTPALRVDKYIEDLQRIAAMHKRGAYTTTM